ncbi:hypothetical protein MP228_010880 [Amoeboaphelidium protococcarum]|nr:hypothetical protein MP228_010880 [Amoeboaphelidium protococcarum]
MAVMNQISQQLVNVLQSLSSSDNNVRTSAEEQLNQFAVQYPDQLLLGLMDLLTGQSSSPPALELSIMSAVVLRRIGFKPLTGVGIGKQQYEGTVWQRTSAQTRQQIKSQLIRSFQSSSVSDGALLKKISDLIIEVAYHELSVYEQHGDSGNVQGWPELLPALFAVVQSNQNSSNGSSLVTSAYHIIAEVPMLFGSTDPQSEVVTVNVQLLPSLRDFLLAGMKHQSHHVRVAAVLASCRFLQWKVLESQMRVGVANELMPHIGNVLVSLYSADGQEVQYEDELVEVLTCLIELSEDFGKLFKIILPQLIGFMVQILCNQSGSLEDSTRHMALELIVSLAENIPALCRKVSSGNGGNFCQQVVPHVMKLMTEIEDSTEWSNTNDIDDEPSDANHVVGEQAIDRLACAIGPKQMLPVVFDILPQFMGSTEWKLRYAALMCISSIAEGCKKLLEQELGKLLQMIVPFVKDSHHRVRYAACNALGQLSSDFEQTLQSKYHQLVVPALCSVMDPQQEQSRVMAHAAAALVNFCEGAQQHHVSPYLEHIFQRLTVLVSLNKLYVQEQAITSLAVIADSAAEEFVKYYPMVMPALINILQQQQSSEFRLLRGKTIECASLIALAVGRQCFAPDAATLMQAMMQVQQSITEADDPQSSYLLSAWARIAKVLSQDFVPYLPTVLPPLLEAASHKPDFAVLDKDDEPEDKGMSEEDGWEFLKIEGQQFGIKTTALDEKRTAVEMLVCYAREMGAHFQPYAERVLDICLPLLKFYFDEGTRVAAAMVIPYLFRGLKEASSLPGTSLSQDVLRELWTKAVSSLLNVIQDEVDAESLQAFLTAFYESVDIMGDNCLLNLPYKVQSKSTDSAPIQLLDMFNQCVQEQLQEIFSRLHQKAGQKNDEDLYDNDLEEALQEEQDNEDSALSDLSRCIHVVLKTHRLNSNFSTLVPTLKQMIGTQQTAGPGGRISEMARQWAICAYVDYVEFCGAREAYQYKDQFFDKMVEALQDSVKNRIRE